MRYRAGIFGCRPDPFACVDVFPGVSGKALNFVRLQGGTISGRRSRFGADGSDTHQRLSLIQTTGTIELVCFARPDWFSRIGINLAEAEGRSIGLDMIATCAGIEPRPCTVGHGVAGVGGPLRG